MEDKKVIENIDVICCDMFKRHIKEFGWYTLDHLGKKQFLMPHIKGTNIRFCHCPSCGGECRDVVLSEDFYNDSI